MTITPISTIQHLPANAVLECIEGTITKVYPDISKGTSQYGDWSIQKGTFRGTDGVEIPMKFCDMVPIGNDWCGHAMRISKAADPKAKSLKVDEYQGKKSIKIDKSAMIEWNPPGMAAPGPAQGPPQQQHAPQGPSGPPQHQQNAQAPQGPPAQRQPQQSAPQQSAPPQRKEIFGATVGMAIKLAGDFMIADLGNWPVPGSPDFSACLYEIASDIVRVSQRMESGTLAKSPSVRLEKSKAQETATRGNTYVEPDYSQAPPPNSRESGQTDTAAGRYGPQGEQAQYQPERPAAFQSGGSMPGIEDDEIPF